MSVSGIYKIINKTNGKYYIGSSKNIKYRWYNHKTNLICNKHHNDHLQNAWNKYGKLEFDFVIVEEIPEEKLLLKEQQYLDIAKTEIDKCYNTKFITGGGAYGEVLVDTRNKMSKKKEGENNPRYNKTEYTFQNEQTGEIYKGTKYQFKMMVNACKKSVDYLIRGLSKSVKGWVVMDESIKKLYELNKKPRKNDYVFTIDHKNKLVEAWSRKKNLY